MAKLEGIDVSHWNHKVAIAEHKPDFVMIKATEGVTFKDPDMLYHYWLAQSMYVPSGFYHYARAEKNTPEAEAEHFISTIPETALGFGHPLALDFEGKALSLKDVDSWALRFMQHIYNKTGVKPLLYASQSTLKRFPKTADFGCGLWVARYRNKALGYGDIKPWKFAAMWQYTSNPIDRDIFYGNKTQFEKYGKGKES